MTPNDLLEILALIMNENSGTDKKPFSFSILAYSYLDLQLYYIETGTSLTRQYGDMYESFFDSLLSVMGDVAKVLAKPENNTLYTYFLPRLKHLYRDGDGFGWGYSDALQDLLESIAEAHGDRDVFPKRSWQATVQ